MSDVATPTKSAQSVEDVRKKGEAALENAKTAASDVLETGKARAQEELTHGKSYVARQVTDAAHAAKTAAQDLRDREQPMLAEWADAAADGISQAAHEIDGRSVGEIFHKVEDFARRQPAMFLAGVALAGFAAARFAKSARDNTPAATTQAPAAYPYPSYPERNNG